MFVSELFELDNRRRRLVDRYISLNDNEKRVYVWKIEDTNTIQLEFFSGDHTNPEEHNYKDYAGDLTSVANYLAKFAYANTKDYFTAMAKKNAMVESVVESLLREYQTETEERAKAMGFDVDNPVFHWSPLNKGDFKSFDLFQHFGTAQAAHDRYVAPLGTGQNVAQLRARKENPPPEGATFKVVINKRKVLHLGEDTGSHDPIMLALVIESLTDADGLASTVTDIVIDTMTDQQVEDWAKANDSYYLMDRDNDDDAWDHSTMRQYIEMEIRDRVIDPYLNGYDEGSDYAWHTRALCEHGNVVPAFKYLLNFLNKRGITALSYVNNIEDPGSVSWIVPDPKNVRSINAKFSGDTGEDMLESSGESDQIDTVTLDIPLLIRVLEFSREDAKTDMDLHDLATKMIAMSRDGKTLTMAQYKALLQK